MTRHNDVPGQPNTAAAPLAAHSHHSPAPHAGRTQKGGGRSAISERDAATIMRRALLSHSRQSAPDDLGYIAVRRAAQSGGVQVAVNIDTLVQSTDMPPGMTLRQAARKSVVACASDFAAKGVRPRFGTVSVSMPKGVRRADVSAIARGFAGAASAEGIRLVAGDTNAGAEFAFTVCLIGTAPAGLRKAGRGGAAPGDLIFVSGPFGYTGLGLDLLLKGGGAAKPQKTSDPAETRAKRSVLHPAARTEFGLRCARYFTSSMDSSDGLASTLNEMGRQSACEFEVNSLPVTRQLERYARRNRLDLRKIALYGGEEYEIVFTARPDARGRVMALAEDTGTPVIEIGVVLAPKRRSSAGGGDAGQKGAAGGAYMLLPGSQGRSKISDLGWDHFAGQ